MTNENINVMFFSFKNLVFKEKNCCFNLFLDVNDINNIAAIYSYNIIYDSILKKEK